MATNRCGTCGINYPVSYRTKTCPIHKTDTYFFDSVEPDDDWEIQAQHVSETVNVKPAESLDELIPLIDTEVTLDGGAYFVSSWDVYDVTRGKLYPDDLLRVGKQTFVVLEYHEAGRRYWVRPFETTVTDEGIASLLGG